MSSKSGTKRELKVPLNELKSKKWCFPPSPLRERSNSRSSSSTSRAKSPEPNCPICLGKIEDKSFADRCFHCFCRLCLFEWSKVKAECPVCRQQFEKIIFNIRAMDDYDEEVVPTSHRFRIGLGSPFVTFNNADGVPRFRYPTTLTPLRRRMLDFERQLQYQFHDYRRLDTDYSRRFPENLLNLIDSHRRTRNASNSGSNNIRSINTIMNPNTDNSNDNSTSIEPPMYMSGPEIRLNHMTIDLNPPSYRPRRDIRQLDPMRVRANYGHYDLDIFPPQIGTSAHRRYIYDSDLWVMTNGDGSTSRTREVTARFFASNPACTHRLIPWLNRELNAILTNPNETETLIPRLMDALLKYDITGVGFKKIISPFTLDNTNHFIHEFYNFARSPYDIEQYTRISVYVPRHRAAIVESEPLPAPVGYRIEPDSPLPPTPDSIFSSDSSVEVLGSHSTGRPALQSPGVYSIGDTDDSSTEIRQLITPSPVITPSLQEGLLMRSSENAVNILNGMTSALNSTPIPRGDLPDVNFGNIDIIDDFDNPKPGTSGLRLKTTAQTKWSDSDSTDIDVGNELEAAIARFENRKVKNEVKSELKSECRADTKNNQNKDNVSEDSDASSVLIVGYVKPLHERTPEFVDLISPSEEDERKYDLKSHKSLKKDKREKHKRKSRFHSRSVSPHMHSHSKRKCKHKSRDRSKDRHESRHRYKSYKYWKHSRSRNSTTTTSSSSSSSSDDSKKVNNSYKRKRHSRRRHSKHHSRHLSHDYNRDNSLQPLNSYYSIERKANTSTASTSTAVTSRPSSIGSVVIRKQPIETKTLKFNNYYIYSDSD